MKNWEESYKKAAKLVGEMSLVEKVNITTGIGWAQGFCVGMSPWLMTNQLIGSELPGSMLMRSRRKHWVCAGKVPFPLSPGRSSWTPFRRPCYRVACWSDRRSHLEQGADVCFNPSTFMRLN